MIIKNINPFEKHSGSANITSPRALILLFVMLSFFAVLLAKLEIIGLNLHEY